MADKLQSGIVALPVFVDGEQPSAGKLNSLGNQTQNGMTEIEKSIGDIHDESYPYATSTGTHLIQPNGRSPISGNDLPGAIERRLDIANLARLIGPAANLNPTILDIQSTVTGERVPDNIYEFELRYPPVAGTCVFSNVAIFGSLKAAPQLISTAGDYAISGRTVYTASMTAGSGTVAYDTDPLLWGQGSAYTHARFNVIPDPNQVDIGSSEQLGIVGPDINGRYTITLPRVRYQQKNFDSDNTALSATEDSNYNIQLQLPFVLTNNFTPGEVVPEGFLYLRNHTTGELYESATYYYNSETSIQIAGVDLSGSAAYDYYLITVGSDITTSIDDLRDKQFKHRHDGTYGEPKIDVLDLCGITKYQGASGPWSPSEIPGNFAPQYLHRDGLSNDDCGNLNDRNGLRGWLAFCFQGQDAGKGFNPSSPEALTATFGLLLGRPGSSYRAEIYKSTAGNLHYHSPDAVGWLPNSGLHFFENGPVYAYEGLLAGSMSTLGSKPWKVYTCTESHLISDNDTEGVGVPGLIGKTFISISAMIDVSNIMGIGTPYWIGPGDGKVFYSTFTFPFSVEAIPASGYIGISTGAGHWNGSEHTVRYIVHYTD